MREQICLGRQWEGGNIFSSFFFLNTPHEQWHTLWLSRTNTTRVATNFFSIYDEPLIFLSRLKKIYLSQRTLNISSLMLFLEKFQICNKTYLLNYMNGNIILYNTRYGSKNFVRCSLNKCSLLFSSICEQWRTLWLSTTNATQCHNNFVSIYHEPLIFLSRLRNITLSLRTL